MKPKTKLCPRCKKTKASLEFYLDIYHTGDLSSWCKECTRESNRTTARRRKYSNNKLRWIKRNKEKDKAHNRVKWLIKKGLLIRENCTICDTPRGHAHHIDYEYPDRVIWLCLKHHQMAHSKVFALLTDV